MQAQKGRSTNSESRNIRLVKVTKILNPTNFTPQKVLPRECSRQFSHSRSKMKLHSYRIVSCARTEELRLSDTSWLLYHLCSYLADSYRVARWMTIIIQRGESHLRRTMTTRLKAWKEYRRWPLTTFSLTTRESNDTNAWIHYWYCLLLSVITFQPFLCVYARSFPPFFLFFFPFFSSRLLHRFVFLFFAR